MEACLTGLGKIKAHIVLYVGWFARCSVFQADEPFPEECVHCVYDLRHYLSNVMPVEFLTPVEMPSA